MLNKHEPRQKIYQISGTKYEVQYGLDNGHYVYTTLNNHSLVTSGDDKLIFFFFLRRHFAQNGKDCFLGKIRKYFKLPSAEILTCMLNVKITCVILYPPVPVLSFPL